MLITHFPLYQDDFNLLKDSNNLIGNTCCDLEETQAIGHKSVLESTEHRFGISAKCLELANDV